MMMMTVEVTMMLGYLCGIANPANNLFCSVDLFYHTDRDIGSLKGGDLQSDPSSLYYLVSCQGVDDISG